MSFTFVSTYARKYGVRGAPMLGKSFLTPVDTVFPTGIELSAQELERNAQNRAAENFQKQELYGFTTRELVDLDAISARYLKPQDLSNGIIPPLLRWVQRPYKLMDGSPGYFYPIGFGYPGVWAASNPIVWSAMYPALVLASQMLTSIHMLPWFDALFNGNVYPIDPSRLPPSIPEDDRSLINSFHLQNPQSFNRDKIAQQRDEILEFMCGARGGPHIRFGFLKSNEVPFTRQPDPLGNMYGMTQLWDVNMRNTPIAVHINYKLVFPLLNQTLTPAERLGGQWFLANTVLHEMTHAIYGAKCVQDQIEQFPEPYFEDEPLAELGFSMEQSVFGGIPEPIAEDLNGIPLGYATLGYFLATPFPCICWTGACEPTVLTKPPIEQYISFYPIKASFFEDVQQQGFWDLSVRQYGFKVFHKRSLLVGAQVYYRDEANHTSARRVKINAPLPFPWNEHQDPPSQEDLLKMSPLERQSGDYVRQLVKAAKNEDDFFRSSKSMQDEANKILEMVKTHGRNTPAVWQENRFLHQVIQEHIKATQALLSSEQASDGIEYTDRRENLLRWNIGIRAFIRQLTGESEINEFIDLEYARMSLADPEKTPSANSEIAWLQVAFDYSRARQYAECLDLCNRILAEPSSSLFLASATRILMSVLRPVRSALEPRALDLDVGFSCLKQLRDIFLVNQYPVPWRGFVDGWIEIGEGAYKLLHEEHTAAEAADRDAAAADREAVALLVQLGAGEGASGPA